MKYISDENFAKFCSHVQEGMESLAQAIENGRHPQYAKPTAVYIGIPGEKNNFCRLAYSCFDRDKKDILTLSILRSEATKNLCLRDTFVTKILRFRSGLHNFIFLLEKLDFRAEYYFFCCKKMFVVL